MKDIPVVEFLDRDEMVKYLEQEVKDETVPLEGSNSMGLSAVADKFAELAEKNIKTAIKLLKERRDLDWNSTRTLSLIFL